MEEKNWDFKNIYIGSQYKEFTAELLRLLEGILNAQNNVLAAADFSTSITSGTPKV